MFCPKCKCEYIDGIFTCPDCNVYLVHHLISNIDVDKKLQSVIPVKIKSVSNGVDAELIMNLLKNNNIHCFSKSREAGHSIRIISGYSVYGEDIYVDRRNYQKALNLLNEVADYQEQNDEEDCDSDYQNSFNKNIRVIGFIVLGVYAIISIIFIITGILDQIRSFDF